MIVGCFIYAGGMNLATISSYLTLWLGGQAGMDGFRLGYFALAGPLLLVTTGLAYQ